MRRRVLTALVVAGGLASAPAAVAAPGPPLSISDAAAARSLSCPQTFTAPRGPVLLVHGTGANADVWNLGMLPALTGEGYDVCRVALPEAAEADVQLSAEYVVAAIRQIALDAGRPVAVIGHSQGGMLPRWAIRWWPDIRTRISMAIGIEPSNHGSPLTTSLCAVPCRAAAWQQAPDSAFLAALNATSETVPRVPYTTISSTTDTTVPTASSRLTDGADVANVVTQTVCPGRQVDHGPAIDDAPTYALALDALTHGGLAQAGRIDRAVCAQRWIAGHSAQEFDQAHRDRDAFFAATYPMGPLLTAEPALRAYTTAAPPDPVARLTVTPRRLTAGRRTGLRVRATGVSGTDTWPLPGARVRVAGRTLVTGADGQAVARIVTRKVGRRQATLTAGGLAPVRVTLTVVRSRSGHRR